MMSASTAASRCPDCGAELAQRDGACWLCGAQIVEAELVAAKPARGSDEQRALWVSSIAAWVLLAIVAVGLVVVFSSPVGHHSAFGPAFLVAESLGLAVVALLFIILSVHALRSGQPWGVLRASRAGALAFAGTLMLSVAVAALAAIASMIAFIVTCEQAGSLD